MIFEDGFVGCCGINILYGFGKTSSASVRNYDNVKTVLEEVKRNLSTKTGITLIALNEEQRPIYESSIGTLGFYPVVFDAYHNGHGKKITLYARINNPNKSYMDGTTVKSKTKNNINF